MRASRGCYAVGGELSSGMPPAVLLDRLDPLPLDDIQQHLRRPAWLLTTAFQPGDVADC